MRQTVSASVNGGEEIAVWVSAPVGRSTIDSENLPLPKSYYLPSVMAVGQTVWLNQSINQSMNQSQIISVAKIR